MFVNIESLGWVGARAAWGQKNYAANRPASAFVQVSSSSRHRERPDDQVCIGDDFSKLAKYE